MRILIVSQYFWPENFRINELVAELLARGHQVLVMTGFPNYPSGEIFAEYRRAPADFNNFGGAEIIRVPIVSRGQSRLRLAFNYISFVLSGSLLGPWKLRGKKIDAIFVFLVSPITASLPAIVIGRLKGAPVALWILDLWPDTLSAVGVVRSKVVLGFLGRLVSFIYRNSARIFIQSNAFTSNVAHYAGGIDRVRYLPGWAEQIFEESSNNRPSPFEPFSEKFKILFAGNIGDAQDFPSILAAVDHLRHRSDIHWIIVGDGRARPYVEKEVAKRGLGGLVTLMGRQPIESMPSFFGAADALLVSLKADPIFSMTIPGKVQSYLASGVPILAMLDGEGARVIADAGAGLVCPAGDGEELARQAVRLASVPTAERALMGARGRSYASREFNRSVLISRLEQELAELVGSSR
ncbi:glycosyltransferase family 4 protein [Bradyrhizobium centrosematis]|uniref:glycosyltransferase family 4 protein n=1 Tax=Bradyrhizobium centrosematis TaxID=1300039 RepID=UPI00216851DD|nr:glycosyltransferase family 4 protein [Bradyrhizobium centrosematis]MCS3765334.1 glycosyltransferase involved in cell wall biosynthesis [Bradyrhizobium centrosematis]MCS3773966.1 glycosyltransferase involved in cell wall biosynthesis [Bradyrhizobium centrosematis]